MVSRKRAIIEAARALFAEQGFERTTLGDIVDRAGGSLATVYKVFKNKEGLLEAVVFDGASSGETMIRDAVAQGGKPAEILHRIAEGFNAHFLDPETVALVRIVIARSMCDRDFAQLFHEQTASRTRQALEQVFAHWHKQGIEMSGPPEMLAELFLAQFVSDLHINAISHGTGIEHTPERLRARTDFFIGGAGLDRAE